MSLDYLGATAIEALKYDLLDAVKLESPRFMFGDCQAVSDNQALSVFAIKILAGWAD